MAEQARVNSIEALVRFRASLAEFGVGARHALDAIDMELRRVGQWLEAEQPRYWQGQVRLWDRRLAEARSALHRKNLQRTDGYAPDVTQEKEALRVCKQRIEEAQQKLQAIKRWGPQFHHALSEYRGRTRALADASTIDIERMLAMLERMIDALEAYVSTTPSRAARQTPPTAASTDPGPSPVEPS